MACDVSLVALSLDGATVCVPAHKYVLVSRNAVFRAMLCGPLADGADTIHIADLSSEALVELLRSVAPSRHARLFSSQFSRHF